MQTPVDLALSFYSKFEEGKVFLGTGSQIVKINTKKQPVSVWFSEIPGNIPVCQGNLNFYSIILDEDGFLVYGEIESDSVEFEWIAMFE